ncbi:U32 family peptidase [Adlercreutzia equolifaciens]|uniref:U32 family peptidase n=1 Tax=Adlercreutzia equolifaciens TaxID=446660 RepID=UPI0023B188E0|nr:U32 family peptidase [Adlercreutzia equolifaciens]MDE8701861.1 U32 family peptidase [Adlercreutzia equolifaciens]
MNILVPFNDPTALEDFLDAGVGEFYMGFYDEPWTARFGETADLNRLSGFGSEANALPFEEVLSLIPAVKEGGAQLYVPFNAGIYSSAQQDYIAHAYFPFLAEAGVDGVILSGPELVRAARTCGLKAVASTMCGIFNQDIARFYQNLGMERIIFPRELSLADIEAVIDATPGLEYEAFLMRNGCVFSDSHCLGCHRAGHYSLCRDLRFAERWEEQRTPNAAQPTPQWDRLFAEAACGLCALWHFERLGINAGKIVGRCDEREAILRDIRLVRRHIDIASACSSHEEFRRCMELPEGYKELCASRLNCYYPEVE